MPFDASQKNSGWPSLPFFQPARIPPYGVWWFATKLSTPFGAYGLKAIFRKPGSRIRMPATYSKAHADTSPYMMWLCDALPSNVSQNVSSP